MPTGYTSGVAEGKVVTFAEFATECARAFGALIEMRDEPLGAQIPEEFFPSEYHVEELKKSQRDLAQFEKMERRPIGERSGESICSGDE